MMYPDFLGPSATAQSWAAVDQRTVNWYLERTDVPGGAPFALYPTPGVRRVATLTDAPGRGGILEHKGRAFFVAGSGFYEIAADGAVTRHGDVAVDGYPATLCTNGDGGGQIFVTSGDNGYIFTLATNVLTLVRTGATRIGAHLDGYFLALDTATSTLFLSDLLDGTTWDPAQFAQRSIQPDPWVSMAVLDRYIYLFGEKTSEIWYNAGTYPMPFAPHPSGLLSYGCAASFAPKEAAGSLHWLGATKDGEGVVVRASGFTPEVVSSYELQRAVASYGTHADAVGDAHQIDGHTFYCLTFPSAGTTWAFDVTSAVPMPARWAERGTWDQAMMAFEAWRPLFHGFAFEQHLILDRLGDGVYELTSASGVDVEDKVIRRLRRAPALQQEHARVFVPAFEVLMEPGNGLQAGQGSDPQIALRVSQDGGRTWGNERWRSAGPVGHYRTRARWLRNGVARRWQPEVVVSDPIPWKLVGAVVDAHG